VRELYFISDKSILGWHRRKKKKKKKKKKVTEKSRKTYLDKRLAAQPARRPKRILEIPVKTCQHENDYKYIFKMQYAWGGIPRGRRCSLSVKNKNKKNKQTWSIIFLQAGNPSFFRTRMAKQSART
jgi:hypothetical protein